MCGINGITFSDKDLIVRMQEFTRNKGPDANGIYCDENITLSHDRLSILDLSDDANQPMVFENLIISFNKS
jgi:asparagine synthase (glutamine-hydrolysing)